MSGTPFRSRNAKKHMREAMWGSQIMTILVEPFATREEVLAAEAAAINAEYPKFNVIYNGSRHPLREMRRLQKLATRSGG